MRFRERSVRSIPPFLSEKMWLLGFAAPTRMASPQAGSYVSASAIIFLRGRNRMNSSFSHGESNSEIENENLPISIKYARQHPKPIHTYSRRLLDFRVLGSTEVSFLGDIRNRYSVCAMFSCFELVDLQSFPEHRVGRFKWTVLQFGVC